jgi:hypothetical protein
VSNKHETSVREGAIQMQDDQSPKVHYEKQLSSWSEYRDAILHIRGQFGHHSKGDERRYANTIAYRGHRCATWALKTTLEREYPGDFTALQYFERATRHRRELESLTGSSWHVPNDAEAKEQLARDADSLMAYPPAYPFLVYLRHHSFPSPLLDWSLSPYVAAYFAFAEANHQSRERVAIYAYIPTPRGTKTGWLGAPLITLLGPRVATDRRHFLQQAVYTWCVKPIEESGDFWLCSHHDILAQPSDQQDTLVRITLPASEKKAALSDLQAHNINQYTLFGTEDALAKTIAMKAFVLD